MWWLVWPRVEGKDPQFRILGFFSPSRNVGKPQPESSASVSQHPALLRKAKNETKPLKLVATGGATTSFQAPPSSNQESPEAQKKQPRCTLHCILGTATTTPQITHTSWRARTPLSSILSSLSTQLCQFSFIRKALFFCCQAGSSAFSTCSVLQSFSAALQAMHECVCVYVYGEKGGEYPGLTIIAFHRYSRHYYSLIIPD